MNYDETKRLCEAILKEEIKKNNLDVDYHCCGKIQYYNKSNNILKKNLKYRFQKKDFVGAIVLTLAPMVAAGYYLNNTPSITVFIKGKTLLKSNESPYKSLFIIYHELYHAVEDKRRKDNNNKLDFSSYDNFFSDIDHLIYENFFRAQYAYSFGLHENFMFEIMASKKGIENLKKYIEKNQLKVNVEELKKVEEKYNNLYNEANLSKSLDFIINNYSKIKKSKKFDNSFFEIFLTENGDFKNLDEIISNENFHLINPKIIKAFFSTNKFIKSFNIANISYESQKILFEILNNEHNKQPNQIVIEDHTKFETLDFEKQRKISKIKSYSLIIIIAILSKFIANRLNINDDSFINEQLSDFFSNFGTLVPLIPIHDIILNLCAKYKFNVTNKEIDDILNDIQRTIEKVEDGKQK